MKEVSIIIPSIQWEPFTEQCVLTVSKLYPGAEVIVLLDFLPDALPEHAPNVQVLPMKGSIAGKRNHGAAVASGKYLAFIDSDAIPHPEWLPTAIHTLQSDEGIIIVGGPNVSPPDQTAERTFVGKATQSWLVSGKWHFYKSLKSKAQYCDNLPSCNMLMRREQYLQMGGMNPLMEVGEDTELCARVLENGGKIYFNPKAIVYHYDRLPLDFLKQRLVRGAGVFLHLFGDSAQKRRLYTYLLLQPVAVCLLLFSLPLGIFCRPWLLLVGSILGIYTLIVLTEAIRHSDRAKYLPKMFFLILAGNLLPGIGFMLKAVRILPSLSTIYRNDNQ